jgi:cytochrome c oxidase subunit I
MAYATLAEDLKELHHPKTWVGKYVWSQDHKVIAVQYMITAIAIGMVALVLSDLMRMQIGFPGSLGFMTPEKYYQFITIHGMIMVIYLLTALLLGGFGNFLIPLMLGARDMVFPFVNMLSYWSICSPSSCWSRASSCPADRRAPVGRSIPRKPFCRARRDAIGASS